MRHRNNDNFFFVITDLVNRARKMMNSRKRAFLREQIAKPSCETAASPVNSFSSYKRFSFRTIVLWLSGSPWFFRGNESSDSFFLQTCNDPVKVSIKIIEKINATVGGDYFFSRLPKRNSLLTLLLRGFRFSEYREKTRLSIDVNFHYVKTRTCHVS